MTGPSPTLWRLLTVTPTRRLFEWLTRDHAIVFMLHRFRDERSGVQGHDPVAVDRALTELRKRGFAFLELEEMVEELIHRASRGSSGLSRTVAFTMDDGYEDQARVGGDLFRTHDCPVTAFLITGFIDGHDWMWWDKIRYLVECSRADLRHFSFTRPGWANPLPDGETPPAIVQRLVAEYHRLEPARRPLALQALSAHAGVELPSRPPRSFAPMTWEQVREREEDGMRFAPHTVNHFLLSELPEETARWEMAGSWKRLTEEVRDPVPVIAYPHGRFEPREERIAREMGLSGGVGDRSGINHPRLMRRDPEARYRLRRVGFPADHTRGLLYASGLGNVVHLFRGTTPDNGTGAG